jgi:hypothetical protein
MEEEEGKGGMEQTEERKGREQKRGGGKNGEVTAGLQKSKSWFLQLFPILIPSHVLPCRVTSWRQRVPLPRGAQRPRTSAQWAPGGQVNHFLSKRNLDRKSLRDIGHMTSACPQVWLTAQEERHFWIPTDLLRVSRGEVWLQSQQDA